MARVEASPRHTGKMYWDLMEKYNDVSRQTARQRAAPLVDLARLLPKSSRYYYDFIHFTNPSAEQTATIISESLCPELARRFPGYRKRSCGS